jgi:hypothetical protein
MAIASWHFRTSLFGDLSKVAFPEPSLPTAGFLPSSRLRGSRYNFSRASRMIGPIMALSVQMALLASAPVRRTTFSDDHRHRMLLARRPRLLRRVVRSIRMAYEENRRMAMNYEIRLHGNGLTRLLHEAATYGLLISITLASRKWYVGYVAEAVNLEPKESCLRLLPMISGYRDKDTLQFVRQVYYRPVYEAVQAIKGSITRFVVTLALEDVHDAREFDDEIYEDHFSQRKITD